MTRRVPELNRAMPKALLYMNTADAAKLSVHDGDTVKLTSQYGEVEIDVSLSGRVEPPAGTVFAPFFAWETLVNLVCQDVYCPISKEPDYKKTPVAIAKVGA